MLPKEFNLENVDEGIRELIITLNRIPEINKRTTIYGPTSCEGHLYDEESEYPSTKDGWIYFYKPLSKRKNLIEKINQFCKEYPYFDSRLMNIMEEWDFQRVGLIPNPSEPFGDYIITASFWYEDKDDEGMGFRQLDIKRESHLLPKAKLRKQELLSGWRELDTRIKEYILKEITKDIESLPYRTDIKKNKLGLIALVVFRLRRS